VERRIGAAVLSVALVAATGLSAPYQATAAVGSWSSSGPFGGTVRAIAINPENPEQMLAGSHGAGIVRSTDGGSTWHPTQGLPKAELVFDISYARSNPDVVYAGTLGFGAVRSDDGGQTWSQIYSVATVIEIEADPFDPDTVFLTETTLRRSQDGGATWEDVWPIEQGGEVIASAPSRPGRFYFSSATRVYRTDDWGDTWQGGGDAEWWVEDLAVDPTNADRLFAATAHGAYRSTNGADSWQDAEDGLPTDGGSHRRIQAIQIDPLHPNVVYAAAERIGGRIFRSADSGDHWSAVLLDISTLAAWEIAAHPTNDDRLLIGMEHDGILQTTDARQTWQRTNRGLIASNIASLYALPGTQSVALAGTIGQGVFRTGTGGASWKNVGLQGLDVEALSGSPAAPRTVYAAAMRHGAGTRGGVFRSTDAGLTWTRTALRNNWVIDLAVAPSDPRVVYAVSRGRAWRSDDGGASWRVIGDGFYSSVSVHPRRSGTVFLGGRSAYFRSTNGGSSWQTAGAGWLPLDVWSFAFDPTNTSVILMAADGGLFRSRDGGKTWRRSGAAVFDATDLQEVTFDPAHPGRVYAAGAGLGGGVFRSNDHGRTWTRFGSGIAGTDVGNLALNAAGDRLYAGTSAFNYGHGAGAFVFAYP
jgi:photosystem II stability/assembly factor-like uncharacterized protein